MGNEGWGGEWGIRLVELNNPKEILLILDQEMNFQGILKDKISSVSLKVPFSFCFKMNREISVSESKAPCKFDEFVNLFCLLIFYSAKACFVKGTLNMSCLSIGFQAEPFITSLVSADNPITLLSDAITILSHVARSSSEYVTMVTSVLQTDQGNW